MNKRMQWIVVTIMILGVNAACDVPFVAPTPTPTLTYTVTPSPTPRPTATPTPTATATATTIPTVTKTATPEQLTFDYEARQEVPGGGFSFQNISGYDVELDDNIANFVSDDSRIIISIYGAPDSAGDLTEEEVIDEFLSEIESRGAGEFIWGETSTILVDEVEGLAVDLTGTMFDSPIGGQAVAVLPPPNQILFALAIANLSADENRWEQGQQEFAALMDSISFGEAKSSSGNACPVSTDATYGYSKDNPIKVGGDAFGGPSRERAYLDSLSGPNGEAVSYERTGSLGYGDTILDIYQITYAGTTKTLYIDEYSYETLMAPLGFTCWQVIPLSAP